MTIHVPEERHQSTLGEIIALLVKHYNELYKNGNISEVELVCGMNALHKCSLQIHNGKYENVEAAISLLLTGSTQILATYQELSGTIG